jgi:hypothetical protein
MREGGRECGRMALLLAFACDLTPNTHTADLPAPLLVPAGGRQLPDGADAGARHQAAAGRQGAHVHAHQPHQGVCGCVGVWVCVGAKGGVFRACARVCMFCVYREREGAALGLLWHTQQRDSDSTRACLAA